MSVLTQHNNNLRTGTTRTEIGLTVEAVRMHFHKLFEVAVDPTVVNSQIVAQPLFVSDLQWDNGTSKDVLIICTMHGTVYAFDARNNCTQIWANWLGQPVQDLIDTSTGKINDAKDLHGTNPEWGILSTPVIDPDLKRIYIVMWNSDNGGTYRLHKLDLITGKDLGNVTIQGEGFNPVFQKQRPGLLLLKPDDLPTDKKADVGSEGTVYIAFGASIESNSDYHGWIFAYDVDTLTQRAVWNSTPNGGQAGIWQAGAGLTADDQGNIYLMTGNGDFDTSKKNFGESFVKLACKDLGVLSSFTPWDWQKLNGTDLDLGSSGPVCIPSTNFIVGAGKTGILYSLDRSNLGGVTNTAPNNDVDEVQATGNPSDTGDHHVHGSPVYYEPLNYIYLWGEQDVLKAFKIDPKTGRLSKTPVVEGRVLAPSGMPGGMLSLSDNGSTNGSANAIIWALLPLSGDANQNILVNGILRAFDATSLLEIWNSGTKPTDTLGHFAKFAPPTIAKGRVYAPTYDGKFVVYGIE